MCDVTYDCPLTQVMVRLTRLCSGSEDDLGDLKILTAGPMPELFADLGSRFLGIESNFFKTLAAVLKNLESFKLPRSSLSPPPSLLTDSEKC